MKTRKITSRKKNEKNKISVVIETDKDNETLIEKIIKKAICKINRLLNGKLSFQVLVIRPNDKHQEA